MKILFVTTAPNAVLDSLQRHPSISVLLVRPGEGKEDFFVRLESLFMSIVIEGILTYRCPFIIPGKYLKSLPEGGFNIHPSLLPKYPGLNPWNGILSGGESTNGVTLHRMSDKVDEGEIILQWSYALAPEDSIESAREKADHLAARLVSKWMSGIK